MIEGLTPQILMSAMLLVALVSPLLTLLFSAVLLQRYRRSVRRRMEIRSGFDPASAGDGRSTLSSDTASTGRRPDAVGNGEALYRRMIHASWQNAARYALAGLGFALVYAAVAHFAFPHALGVPGSLIAVWLYLWPVFIALPLILPLRSIHRFMPFLVYFGVFALLGIWAGGVLDQPAYRFGAVVVPARSSVTPETMGRLWLVLNGGPTLLTWVCMNRRIRAVAPLVLALVTAAVTGLLVTYFAIFSSRGTDLVVAVATASNLHVYWLVSAALLLSLIFFGLLGWILVRWIGRAYRSGRLSDQSLLMDALWLLFASTYSMWLAAGGLVWALSAPLAFMVFRLVLSVVRRLARADHRTPAGLTFLRVFSLGRRSESLFETVAAQWRHLGSIQLITGPDLASSTVQPHQFLDFLSGRLASHFVSDRASLARSLSERDRDPDPDGRYRVNSFFCHADSWKAVLPKLVQEGDIVLMDLRSFAEGKAGCTHELQYLVSAVPFERCLLLTDETTDQGFLEQMLKDALSAVLPGSPNQGRPFSEIPRVRIESGSTGLIGITRFLCQSAAGPLGADIEGNT